MQGTQAQKYEIGPFLGGSNFIGDVGATTYIRPNSLVLGAIGKWNRSPRHSWRATLTYTHLKGMDSKSNQERRRRRDYSFSNKTLELMLGLEFNFWEWDIYTLHPGITPYLASGVSVLLTHDMYLNQNDEIEPLKTRIGFAIPMIIGAKTRISGGLNLGLEIGARMSFYNSLDGSVSQHVEESYTSSSFGNPNQFDWYMFTGVTLTFAFGQNPCYKVY